MGRNYQSEYRKYQGTAVQKKRRAMRNAARRNTRVISASINRSFARNKKAGKA